jgi:archaellum biogenesis protein FlaJ (TadC family)
MFKPIKNNVIERFKNEGNIDLINKFFNNLNNVNISANELEEFIEALNAEKDFLIKNIKNEFEKNLSLENYKQKIAS